MYIPLFISNFTSKTCFTDSILLSSNDFGLFAKELDSFEGEQLQFECKKRTSSAKLGRFLSVLANRKYDRAVALRLPIRCG